jgi:hypothetical protein
VEEGRGASEPRIGRQRQRKRSRDEAAAPRPHPPAVLRLEEHQRALARPHLDKVLRGSGFNGDGRRLGSCTRECTFRAITILTNQPRSSRPQLPTCVGVNFHGMSSATSDVNHTRSSRAAALASSAASGASWRRRSLSSTPVALPRAPV